MKPAYTKKKSAAKGIKDSVVVGLGLWAGTALTAATGIPSTVTVPLAGGLIGSIRNVLKQKLPKAFGWL